MVLICWNLRTKRLSYHKLLCIIGIKYRKMAELVQILMPLTVWEILQKMSIFMSQTGFNWELIKSIVKSIRSIKAHSHGAWHTSVILAFVNLPLSERYVVSFPQTSSAKWIVHDCSHLESNVFDFQAWSRQINIEIWHSQHKVSTTSPEMIERLGIFELYIILFLWGPRTTPTITGWPKSASDLKMLSKISVINLLRKFQLRLHSWSIPINTQTNFQIISQYRMFCETCPTLVQNAILWNNAPTWLNNIFEPVRTKLH